MHAFSDPRAEAHSNGWTCNILYLFQVADFTNRSTQIGFLTFE